MYLDNSATTRVNDEVLEEMLIGCIDGSYDDIFTDGVFDRKK